MKEATNTEKVLIGTGVILLGALLVGAGAVISNLSSVYSDSFTLSLLQCLPKVPDVASTLSAFNSQTHAMSPHFGLGPDPVTPLYKTTAVTSPIDYIEVAKNMCEDMARDAGLDGVRGILGNIANSVLSALR